MATRRNHHPHTFDRTDLQWLDHWDDTHLRNRYGTTTLQRAHSYAHLNKVTDLWTDGHTTIGALVTGNRPEPYETHIRHHTHDTTTWLTCTCTCPLRKDCKHTLATIITARNTRTRPG
ncbi:hypothetical protein GZ193_10075, partial [Dermatophilus congolensis]